MPFSLRFCSFVIVHTYYVVLSNGITWNGVGVDTHLVQKKIEYQSYKQRDYRALKSLAFMNQFEFTLRVALNSGKKSNNIMEKWQNQCFIEIFPNLVIASQTAPAE